MLFNKPTVNNSLLHLQHKTEVRDRSVQVEIEWDDFLRVGHIKV